MKTSFVRRARKLVLTALIIYAGVVLVIMLVQRRLIYLPFKLTATDAESQAAAARLLPWRNAAGELIGWQRTSRIQPARGAVLVTHGNAGWAGVRNYFADSLQAAAPLDVFLLEYPGYGARPGRPCQETILAAAREAVTLLTNRGPVYLIGESLGTGVAAYLAATFPEQVAGIVLFCPYNNLGSVAQRQMPWLPARWMLWDRYPADQWLAQYHGPVGFVLAGEDEIIPVELGRKLFAGYSGPKQAWEVAGGRHNYMTDRPPEWWRELLQFWDHARDQPPAGASVP